MILPFAKLGTLFLRTLSKPLASRLKTQAARHPRFRESIVNLAQANHKFQVNVQRRIYGHATDVEIRPLNEEKAVQAAADLVGELLVFSVGGAVVIFEVQRGGRSEARKEEARKAELEGLRQEVAGLAQRLENLEGGARGSHGFSGWSPPLPKREVNPAPTPMQATDHGTTSRGSDSTFSTWLPRQSV